MTVDRHVVAERVRELRTTLNVYTSQPRAWSVEEVERSVRSRP